MPNLTFAISTRKKINIPRISAGYNFNLITKFSDKSWAWGVNNNGELGDNSITQRNTPVSVLGTVKTFCHISAGMGNTGPGGHSLAIDQYGRAWAWGLNNNGQLGDRSVVAKSTPVSVCGAVKTFCKISAGVIYSLAIDKDGRAWAWGNNFGGKLGNNSTNPICTPVSVCGAVKTFCQISAGSDHSLAIDKNGRAWAWGGNSTGQLGDRSVVAKSTPVSVCGAVKTFCQISAGSNYSLAIDKNGRAWAWGIATNGVLGDNNFVTNRSTPVSVCGAVKTFCKISAFNTHSLAIDQYGRAWAWGLNTSAQLGDNSITQRNTPVSVCGAVKTFCQISAGFNHSLAIDKNAKVWSWGNNNNGQLGIGFSNITPVSICGTIKTFCSISAGYDSQFMLAIDKNGRAWGWGNNTNGHLGDNSITQRNTPVSVLGTVKTFCHISAGNGHSLAIDKNGRVWAWGFNTSGQLGDGSVVSKRTPVSVCGAVKTFCKISAGTIYSLAIDKNGRAWAWGNNTNGQLGDRSVVAKSTPVSVCGAVKTFCQISAGINYSLAIDKNGRAWAWGGNTSGQLGDRSIVSKSTPVSVCGAVKTFCKISAGGGTLNSGHSLVIDKNGRLWAWGNNNNGQLGDRSNVAKSTPVSVCGAVKTFCHISASGNYSLAIDKNGTAWAWGNNTNGQLGDNSTTNKSTPVSVCGAVKTFCQISAGGTFGNASDCSLAIDKNGKLWAWGNNFFGQLGRNVSQNTPIMISNL